MNWLSFVAGAGVGIGGTTLLLILTAIRRIKKDDIQDYSE